MLQKIRPTVFHLIFIHFLFSQSSVLDDYINNVDPYTEYSVVSSERGFGLPVMF
jgi:hypothetical protein